MDREVRRGLRAREPCERRSSRDDGRGVGGRLVAGEQSRRRPGASPRTQSSAGTGLDARPRGDLEAPRRDRRERARPGRRSGRRSRAGTGSRERRPEVRRRRAWPTPRSVRFDGDRCLSHGGEALDVALPALVRELPQASLLSAVEPSSNSRRRRGTRRRLASASARPRTREPVRFGPATSRPDEDGHRRCGGGPQDREPLGVLVGEQRVDRRERGLRASAFLATGGPAVAAGGVRPLGRGCSIRARPPSCRGTSRRARSRRRCGASAPGAPASPARTPPARRGARRAHRRRAARSSAYARNVSSSR